MLTFTDFVYLLYVSLILPSIWLLFMIADWTCNKFLTFLLNGSIFSYLFYCNILTTISWSYGVNDAFFLWTAILFQCHFHSFLLPFSSNIQQCRFSICGALFETFMQFNIALKLDLIWKICLTACFSFKDMEFNLSAFLPSFQNKIGWEL